MGRIFNSSGSNRLWMCLFLPVLLLKTRDLEIKGKSVVISGSGNVAQYAAEKVLALGGKVLTLSDSSGFILDQEGINEEKLKYVMQLKKC